MPASSLQAPLATQFQLRCNAASLAEHAAAPVPGLEKHNPTLQKGTKARGFSAPSAQ